jgi:preprotein translocase subunit SecD
MRPQIWRNAARLARAGIAAIFLSGIFAGDASQFEPFAPAEPRFAIRIVDEAVDGRSTTGPANEDRFPNARLGPPNPGARWVKRDGGVEGELAEAHVASVNDDTRVVQFELTPKGRDQFAALTRANLGHWLAIVVDGKIVTAWLNGIEMTEGKGQISGYYTEAEARALASAMNETKRSDADRGR